MHDPHTLAFDIYLGKKEKKNGHYRTPFISIWHKDPETDGSDDSCGWFIRGRHIDPDIIEKVKKEFEFNFKHDYWFNDGGYPQFSTMGTALNMYSSALWQILMYQNGGKPDRKRQNAFMKKHLWDILHFAENPTDSLHASIHMKFGVIEKEERIREFTSIITADIFRKLRPWYKHPHWHIHHWQLTFPLFRSWYRLYIETCDRCHKRLKSQSVYSDWSGTEHWCEKCNGSSSKVATS